VLRNRELNQKTALTKVDFIDPRNSLVLISPEIGKVYTCTVYLKNDSTYLCSHIRILHDYEDVKTEPSYIENLKPSEVVPIRIDWKPFTEQGIREKVKDGKTLVVIMPKCTVEIGD
jgi:hypothetical protein